MFFTAILHFSSYIFNCLSLPSVMCERLVCRSHLMNVLPFFNGAAGIVGSINYFRCKTLAERLSFSGGSIHQKPSDGKGNSAVMFYFDRNLICRTADAARFYFQKRFYIFHRAFQNRHRFLFCFFFYYIHRIVTDCFGMRTFPAFQHIKSKPGDN